MRGTIEVGAQRVIGEVLFPQTGCEEVDLKRGMGIDALQHIDQIARGIDTLETTRRQQTLNEADMAGTDFRPTEEPMSDRPSLRKGKVYGPVIDGNFL